MKKISIALIFASIVFASIAHAQLLFSVKPGLTGNSAQFGIKLGGLMAFGGLEYFRTATTTETSGLRYIYQYSSTYPYTTSYQLVPYSDKYEASVNAYVPFVGAKVLLGGRESGKIGAYITGIIGKPFLSGKTVSNGIESESTKKFFDNLSAWMFLGGFGTEYFFSENFSIGGEFGLRVFLINYNEEANEPMSVYNSQTGTYQYYNAQNKYKFDLGMGITYSTLVLNYYF
ncbi:MAG: hypothetical protein NTX44_08830 [Ignavibacteriales bacterium]|nr:hypothetical protein [Ignavibacteriales bacterium]